MRRNLGWIVLALSLVAVTVHNVRFFAGLSEPAAAVEDGDEEGSFEDGDGEELAGNEAEPLAPLTRATLAAYLVGLENIRPRSPFMTASEAERRTAGPWSQEPDSPLPVLAGTLWSHHRRVAWIDGYPRSEGDLVAGLIVMQIDRDSVLLSSEAEEIRIQVSTPPAPAPPPDETTALDAEGDAGEI